MVHPDMAKYLGCYMYTTGGGGKELGRIRGDAACVGAPKWTLLSYDAVIRSKLAYGMFTMAPAQGQMSRVDAFQLRGSWHILKCST